MQNTKVCLDERYGKTYATMQLLFSPEDIAKYSVEEMDFIYNKLLTAASKITNKEHVKNIRHTQSELKQGICPRCGGKLVEREGKYGAFYGCSNYPKCTFILNKK